MTANAATAASELTREQIIEATAFQLEDQSLRISVRDGMHGWPEPVPTNGHVPDIRARWVDMVILVACETAETLHTAESSARWQAFGKSYLRLEVACPAAIVGEARELARRRGVRVHRYWVY